MNDENDETMYHVDGSRVAHHDRDCHHLSNANDDDVEELDSEDAEEYRTCSQCAYNQLSFAEKAKRKRKQSRRSSRSTTVRIRR